MPISKSDPDRKADTFTREELFSAIGPFIENHWPKNVTATDGGPATPVRGDAMAHVAMFVVELDPSQGTVCEGTHGR